MKNNSKKIKMTVCFLLIIFMVLSLNLNTHSSDGPRLNVIHNDHLIGQDIISILGIDVLKISLDEFYNLAQLNTYLEIYYNGEEKHLEKIKKSPDYREKNNYVPLYILLSTSFNNPLLLEDNHLFYNSDIAHRIEGERSVILGEKGKTIMDTGKIKDLSPYLDSTYILKQPSIATDFEIEYDQRISLYRLFFSSEENDQEYGIDSKNIKEASLNNNLVVDIQIEIKPM